MGNIVLTMKWTAAIIGGMAGVLVGEVNGVLYALLAFMAVDYLTGLTVAVKEKELNSEVGFIGLSKKMMILLVVVLGNVLDVYVIGSGAIMRSAVIAFYIANEGLSILENLGKLNIPYPEQLEKVLVQLKDKKDGD